MMRAGQDYCAGVSAYEKKRLRHAMLHDVMVRRERLGQARRLHKIKLSPQAPVSK